MFLVYAPLKEVLLDVLTFLPPRLPILELFVEALGVFRESEVRAVGEVMFR